MRGSGTCVASRAWAFTPNSAGPNASSFSAASSLPARPEAIRNERRSSFRVWEGSMMFPVRTHSEKSAADRMTKAVRDDDSARCSEPYCGFNRVSDSYWILGRAGFLAILLGGLWRRTAGAVTARRRMRSRAPAFHIGVHAPQAGFKGRYIFRAHTGDGCRFIFERQRDQAFDLCFSFGCQFDDDFACAAGGARSRNEAERREPRHQTRKRRRVDAGQAGKIDLALSALAGQYRHDAPHGDAQAMWRQRFCAKLLGNDGANPVHEVGQVIVEIELGGILHEPEHPWRERLSSS